MATTRKSKTTTGGAHARKAGLVPIQLLVTPEEREIVRAAAGLSGCRSMGEFSRLVVEAISRKVKKDKGLQKKENLSEFLLTL